MINKVSEITYQNIADYIRLEVSSFDTALQNELQTYLNVAKEYISQYTGIPVTSQTTETITLDTYPEFVIVVYILCQDMYDNRALYIDSKSPNKVVESILNMHCRNNL